MFPESFLPNLALFVAGQAAAWYYLRTGRFWVGGLGMAALWIAADWAVVASYVFPEATAHQRGALVATQATAAGLVLALGFALWRRRWSPTARRRAALFSAGTAQYLRGEHDAARRTFRRLVRCDPWDAAAWLALGNALRRLGRVGAARRCYRRCRRVDVAGEHADLAAAMLAPPPRPAPAAPSAATPRPSPTRAHPARS